MAGVKITKRVVDAAKPRGDNAYCIFDTEIRGFGLRVQSSGKMSWVLEYRPGGGGRKIAKRRVKLGDVGDMTPDEARRAADKLRARVLAGEDPQAKKQEAREAATVAEIAETFLSDHVGAKRKPGTKAHYEDVLRRIVLPEIGTAKARDVTAAQISKIHLAWRHTPFQANRVLSIVSSLYGFAARRGMIAKGINPAHGLEKYRENARERYLSSLELERLGAAIRLAEADGIPWAIDHSKNTKHVPKEKRATVIGLHAAAALRLLIFTGARLREILHLRWENVDFERGLLLLPDSKTGRKTIILNAPAMQVLSNLPRVGGFVIAGDSAGAKNERPRSDLKRPWLAVSRHAGLAGVRLHDLRHSFASFGAGGGLGLPIIGKLLGHAEARTTQRYSHLADDPLRKASNAIADQIAVAMGEKPAPRGEVILLRGGR